MVYNTSMDKVLTPLSVKSTFQIDDLMECPSFKEKWDAATGKLVEERAREQVASQSHIGDLADGAEEEDDPLESSNPTRYPEDTEAYWKAYASHFVKQYIRLVPEPPSVRGVADLVANSELKSLRGVEGRSCLIVFYDVGCASESHNRPADRNPPHLQENYKKVIQGAIIRRGGQKSWLNGDYMSGSQLGL
jgi:hypothetical protein